MLKNTEEGMSYSLITSIYFPLLLNKLNHKKEKKKNQETSSLFNDNLGSNNEQLLLIM